MTPLFVIHPISHDPATGTPTKSAAEHLAKLAKDLSGDWGGAAAFVDLRFVDTTGAVGGVHPLAWFVGACLELGLPLSPAISFDHEPGYRQAAIAVANDLDTSLLLRLAPGQWHDLGTPVGDGRLLALIAETGRDPDDLHLMIDMQDQIVATIQITAAAVRGALSGLPHAMEWASVTVAGTGMPPGTSDVGRNSDAELPRRAWELWRSLRGGNHRRPSFGDYCVQHPDPLSNFDPRFMDSSAQLRYTVAASWYVARGSGVKRAGNAQIHDLASLVVDHPDFSGATFSWGDRWLSDCAQHIGGPGNQGVWRKVTTNHHLTYVVDQLATLFGP